MPMDLDILGRLSAVGQDLGQREDRGYAPRSTALEKIFDASLLVGGALLGGRALLGTELGMSVLGRFGRGLSNLGFYAREIPRAIGASIAGVPYAQKAKYQGLELLGALRDALPLYARQTEGPGGAVLRSSAQRAELAGILRGQLQRGGFGARAGTAGFTPVNVAQALSDQSILSGIGAEGRDLLERGLSTGILTPEMTVTTGRTGLFTRAGKVFDTRIFRPSNFLKAAYDVASNVRIPFTNFRPVELLAAPLRPFGKGGFAGEVAPGFKIGKGITAPGAGRSFVAGGQLYADMGTGSFSAIEGARGIKLGRPGKVAQAHIERYGQAGNVGNAALKERIRSGTGSFFRRFYDSIQDAIGIGTEFRTKDPVVAEYVVNPYKRITRGQLVELPSVPRGDTLSFVEKLGVSVSHPDPASFLAEGVPNPGGLSFWDKVKAALGKSRKAVYVRPGTSPTEAGNQVVRERVGSWASAGSVLRSPSAPQSINQFGVASRTTQLPYYAYSGNLGETVADVANMMTNRLNDLVGRSFGVGFRPSVGEGFLGGMAAAGKNLAKLYGVYAGLSAGLQYANYADYMLESMTGISPKKAALSVYGGFRVAQQTLRAATGISAGLDYSEDLMPKSVDSGLSWIARTVLPPAAGLLMGGRKGLIGGLAVTAALGGSDPSQSPSDLIKEYSGEKLVPIRKSRYWLLGRQPFEGGQIDFFAPSWFARQMSDYRYTSTQYGSKDEYYSHVAGIDVPLLGSIPLPTPSNAFGLVNLFDGDFLGGGKDYLARKHLYDRPYPDSPGVDQDQAETAAAYLASRGPYDAPLGSGERLGMGTEGSLGERPKSRGLSGGLTNAVDKITELGGIYKFMWWDAPGLSEPGRPALASSSSISSKSREYYDESTGGMFGLNELYRRFVPPEGRTINPMVNNMPDWLPGVRSSYSQDRNFHIDFTLGDPYAKLKMGEFRLPGEAYERLHKLHSGVSGIYDPVDRFLVLADVAPSSYAFKEYKAIVESWAKSGVLDDYWKDKIKTTNLQVKQKMEKFQFVHRRFTGMVTDPSPESTEAKYNYLEKAIGGGWEVLTHDLIPRMGDAIPVLGPIVSNKMLVARSPVEQYMRNEVYGEEFADWRSPWQAFLRPKVNQMGAENLPTAAAIGSGFALFGANPLAAAIMGIAGTTVGASVSEGHDFVPTHRRKEWELQEYFDNIRYVKSEMLMHRAAAMGDQELAQHFESEIGRTAAGMTYGGSTQEFISSSLKALPATMKSYFMPFMGMSIEAKRSVLPYLPEHLQPIFASSWARPKNADLSFAHELNNQFSGTFGSSPSNRVAQYFATNELPDPDWSGWHPDVPLDAVKIKMVDAGVNNVAADIHKFDLFPEHRFRASRFDIDPVMGDMEHVVPIRGQESDLQQLLLAHGFTNLSVRQGIGNMNRSSVNWRTRYDNRNDFHQHVRSALR